MRAGEPLLEPDEAEARDRGEVDERFAEQQDGDRQQQDAGREPAPDRRPVARPRDRLCASVSTAGVRDIRLPRFV
jgi:hypothetical protein